MRAPVEQDHIPVKNAFANFPVIGTIADLNPPVTAHPFLHSGRRSMSGLRAEAGDLDTAVL